jgi:biopolymer transport protein TolR
MSMALKNGGRGRSRRGGPIGEINVTPMVDVMLVLLIVFMVSAPLLTAGVPIDLPQSGAAELKLEGRPLTITIKPGGEVYLGEDEIVPASLLATVEAAAGEAGTDQRIYIRGDASADYGLIMQIMGDLSGAGYARLGLITAKRTAP